MTPGDRAGVRGEPEAARSFYDPLADFDVPPVVRHTHHRHKPRRRVEHRCPWCGRWFRPPRYGSPWRFCTLACRRECHASAIRAGVAAGQSDRDIARRLGLSVATLRPKRHALGVLRGPEPQGFRRYRLLEGRDGDA